MLERLVWMELGNDNLLFFSRSTQHGGTENVILQLCEIFHPIVNKIIVMSADGFEIEKLKTYGIKHINIPDIENKSPLILLAVSNVLKKVVEEEHITVIHTHHRMAAFYVWLTGIYRNCKFINTSHNTFKDKRILTRLAYKNANLVACGEMVKKNLEDYYGFDNVSVIHNAVKPFDRKVVTDEILESDRKNGKYLIANIGRLSEQKGMEYYIQAIPKVIKKHSNVQFYIIGYGEDEVKLKKLGVDLPVKFLGYRDDIQNIMSQLDLVVLSSLWEGFPLTPIEAFSVGKTIVATGVDGTLEIVKDGENGLIVEPKKSDQLSDKIIWFIEHPTEQFKMEKNELNTYQKVFSFKRFSDDYVSFYKNAN